MHEPEDEDSFEPRSSQASSHSSHPTRGISRVSVAHAANELFQYATSSAGKSAQLVKEEALASIDEDVHEMHRTSCKPWLDEEGALRPGWSPWRVTLAKVVKSPKFVDTMLAIIVCNMATVIYETDQDAQCYPKYKEDLLNCPSISLKTNWLRIMNITFLVVYSLEAIALVLAERIEFFRRPENWFDLLICILGWVSEAISGFRVSWLRIWRLTRLARNPRLRAIPEFNMLVSGFTGSMRAIAFGAALLVCVLISSSIVLVQYVNPTNVEINYGDCERCPRGYRTVMAASLTLYQQIVAGDSWGSLSIPNMEESIGAALLLPVIHLVIGLGIMNLILAVIVDRAVEAREAKREDALKKRRMEAAHRKRKMIKMFEELDVDQNGILDLEEVKSAYENSEEFKSMMMHADVNQMDLEEVFMFLDKNHDGETSYIEFCNALDDVTQRDAKVVTSLLNVKLENFRREMLREFEIFVKEHRNERQSMDEMHRKLDIIVEYVAPERQSVLHQFEKIPDNLIHTPRSPVGVEACTQSSWNSAPGISVKEENNHAAHSPHISNGTHSYDVGNSPQLPGRYQSLQALRLRMEQHVLRFHEAEANHIETIANQLNLALSDVETAVLGHDIKCLTADVWSVPSIRCAENASKHVSIGPFRLAPHTPPDTPMPSSRRSPTASCAATIGGRDKPVVDIEIT